MCYTTDWPLSTVSSLSIPYHTSGGGFAGGVVGPVNQQPVPPAIEEAVVREYKRELFWRAKCHTWLIPKPNSHQTPLSFQAARRWRNCAVWTKSSCDILYNLMYCESRNPPSKSKMLRLICVLGTRTRLRIYSVRWRLYLPDSSIHWCHIFRALIFSLRLLQNQCSRRN